MSPNERLGKLPAAAWRNMANQADSSTSQVTVWEAEEGECRTTARTPFILTGMKKAKQLVITNEILDLLDGVQIRLRAPAEQERFD